MPGGLAGALAGLAGPGAPAAGRGAPLSELVGELARRTRGRLIDRVVCAEGFRPLAELLIGDVLLVEGREEALCLARDFPGWRFATPSGDCVDEAGLWGGHREITHGPVGRRVHADELDVALATAAAAVETSAAELAGAEAERERCEAELALARAALERTRGERATASAELRAGEARLFELEGHVAAVAGEGEALAAELAQLTADVAASEAALATSQAVFDAENASLAAAEAERRELEASLDALQREAASREVALTRAEAEHEGLTQRIRDLGSVVGEARTELERARRLAGEQTALAERGEQEVAALCLELVRLKTARAETEAELDTLRTTERAGREAIEAYRRRVDAATRELEELGAQLAEARLAEQRVRLSREELSVRVQEDLGVAAGALLDGFTPEAELAEAAALEALDRRVGELKAELDRLGPVNTEAVHELEEAAGRSEFLGGQRSDLAHSQKSLAEAIRRMDEESERLFLETFDEVREHFQALFRQLFGGGKADLALAEGLAARGRDRDQRAPAGPRDAADRPALRRPAHDDRAGAALRRLPRPPEPVLRAGRSRRGARRRQHRALPRDARLLPRQHAVHRRHAQQGHDGGLRAPLRDHDADQGRLDPRGGRVREGRRLRARGPRQRPGGGTLARGGHQRRRGARPGVRAPSSSTPARDPGPEPGGNGEARSPIHLAAEPAGHLAAEPAGHLAPEPAGDLAAEPAGA